MEQQLSLLIQLIADTYSPLEQARKQSEEKLKEWCEQEGFVILLLTVVSSVCQVDVHIKQAAAIYFKNTITKKWPTSYDGASPDDKKYFLTSKDRDYLRDNIIKIYMESVPAIRKFLLPCFRRMIDDDYEKTWPSLLPSIFHLLSLNDMDSLPAVLDVLLQAVTARNAESSQGHVIFVQGFPYLLSLLQHILSQASLSPNPNDSVYWLIKRVLKIFMNSIVYVMPKDFRTAEFMDGWMAIFERVLKLPIPTDLQQQMHTHFTSNHSQEGTEDYMAEEREWYLTGYWKMKKWAFKSVNRLFHRYGSPQSERHGTVSQTQFVKLYAERYSERILHVYLALVVAVCQYPKGSGYLPERHISLVCHYLVAAIAVKKLWGYMKENTEGLIKAFLFPRIGITSEDIILWEEEPLAYTQKRLDPYSDYDSISNACCDVLLQLVKKRKDPCFSIILSHIHTIFQQYANTPNAAQDLSLVQSKDSALYMFGMLSDKVLAHEQASSMIEQILLNFVLPELSPISNKFLRVRSLWLLQEYESAPINDPHTRITLFQGVLSCLADTSNLPVRVQAAVSLGSFLDDASVSNIIIENIAPIMQVLLELTNLTDLDSLSYVMEKLVNTFPDALSPYAVSLTFQLKEALMRLLKNTMMSTLYNVEETSVQFSLTAQNNEDKEEQDFESATEKLLSACGLFKTLSTLIFTLKPTQAAKANASSVSPNPTVTAHPITNHSQAAAVLEQMEVILNEPMLHVLQFRQTDVFEEVFELIDSLTFMRKCISAPMWHLFDVLLGLFLTDSAAHDFFNSMSAALDNFISYGLVQMAENKIPIDSNHSSPVDQTSTTPGLATLAKVVQVIYTAYTSPDLGESEQDCACDLMTTLLLYASFPSTLSEDTDRSKMAAFRTINATGTYTAVRPYLNSLLELVISPSDPKTKDKDLAEATFGRFTDKAGYMAHTKVILAAFIFDTQATCSFLLEKGLFNSFFTYLVKSIATFTRVFDIRLLLLSLSTLLAFLGDRLGSAINTQTGASISSEQILHSWLDKWFDLLISSLQGLPKAIQKKKELEDDVGNTSSDDDFFQDDSEGEFESDTEDADNKSSLTKMNHAKTKVGEFMGESSDPDALSELDDLDDEDDDEWQDELEEELFMETPIDNLSYSRLILEALSMSPNLPNTNTSFASVIQQLVPSPKQNTLLRALQ